MRSRYVKYVYYSHVRIHVCKQRDRESNRLPDESEQ